jgi:hypothetical protein
VSVESSTTGMKVFFCGTLQSVNITKNHSLKLCKSTKLQKPS